MCFVLVSVHSVHVLVHVCLCLCVRWCVCVSVRGDQRTDLRQESVFSLYYRVGLGNWTQVVKFGRKYHYLMSHLAGSCHEF